MPHEKFRPHTRRSSVLAEEEKAWITFYQRIGTDVNLATEILFQLNGDRDMKRSHLALYLCCKESLRNHAAIQARNRRVGQFVRWFCRGVFLKPIAFLVSEWRQWRTLGVECLPVLVEEAMPHVDRLTREPSFAEDRETFRKAVRSERSAAVPPAAERTPTEPTQGASAASKAA